MQKSFAVFVSVLVMLAFAASASAQVKKVKAPEIVKTFVLTMGDPAEGQCKMAGSFTLPVPSAIHLMKFKVDSDKQLLVHVRECPASWSGTRGDGQQSP